MPRWLMRGVALLLLLATSPAGADRLVTVDGAVVETDGPWKIRGRQVVFTDPQGHLRSLRLDDVDLVASEAATEAESRAADRPTAEESEESRAPVAVITDADVGRGTPPPPVAASAESGSAESESAEPGAAGETSADNAAGEFGDGVQLAVARWTQEEESGVDGVIVSGVLANQGELLVTNPRLTVRAFDEAGDLVVEVTAFLAAGAVAAGDSTTFRAPLTIHEWDFSRLEFETAGNAVLLNPAAPGGGDGQVGG